MRQINELNPVIHRVESPTRTSSASQVAVTMDRKGKVVPKFFLWLPWFGRRSYLVTNSNDNNAVAHCKNLNVNMYLPGSSKPMEVILSYEAQCQPDTEIRLAKALWHKDDNPEERLHSRIRSWISRDFSDDIQSILANKPGALIAVGEKLGARASKELGLLMTLEVKLKHMDRLQRIVVPSFNMRTRAHDWKEKIDLFVEASLMTAPGSESVAYRTDSTPEQLRETIREATDKFFSLYVSLQEFNTELDNSVNDRLAENLNEHLINYGRKIERLILEGENFQVTNSVDHNISVDCMLREFPRPVKVISRVLMNLRDAGRYFSKGRPEITSWLKENVKEVTERTLFELTYRELWKENETKKGEIREELRHRARQIGYDVQHVITITDLEFEVLQNDFPISVTGEFGTKLAKFSVGLEIKVVAALGSRGSLPDLLTRHKNVRESMERQLHGDIEQKMHTIDPERFYMDFEVARDNKGEPVRAILQRLIESTLKKRFKCRAISVVCKQLDTELSRIYDRLASDRKTFSTRVDFMPGQPSITFNGRFRVAGVDHKGWHDFRQAAPFDLDDVAKSVAGHVREALAEHGFSASFESTPSSLKKIVRDWVSRPIKREFGLLIDITHFEKDRHGNEYISEHSDKIWKSALVTQVNTQHAYEEALRDTQQAHALALQSGRDEEARRLRLRLDQLKSERRRSLEEITGKGLLGAGDEPAVDEATDEMSQDVGAST